jgi:DNA polymerase-1
MAMVAVYRAMQQQDLKSKMILQVHDELVFDVHNSEKDLMKKLVKEAMENAIQLDVPMEVELQFGDNWLDAH